MSDAGLVLITSRAVALVCSTYMQGRSSFRDTAWLTPAPHPVAIQFPLFCRGELVGVKAKLQLVIYLRARTGLETLNAFTIGNQPARGIPHWLALLSMKSKREFQRLCVKLPL
ncbi:hypothetical protein I6M76_20665 [Citrobacter cronae]|uniref:hypothetical protein n=1 Tax=Citrobacter cronae TaxID=1748967 RepID=UPI0019022436|nr:hypothetical protein [Citrobacter cronae]MBJ8365017.1 hypothetical protein [Citrobacter cronae]